MRPDIQVKKGNEIRHPGKKKVMRPDPGKKGNETRHPGKKRK